MRQSGHEFGLGNYMVNFQNLAFNFCRLNQLYPLRPTRCAIVLVRNHGANETGHGTVFKTKKYNQLKF